MTSGIAIQCYTCKRPMGWIITHIDGETLRHFLPEIMIVECELCFNNRKVDSKV